MMIETTTEARPATHSDVDVILVMGQQFLDSSAYGTYLRGRAETARAFTQRLMDGPDSALFVVEVDGRVAGCIGAHVGAHLLTGDRIASEVMWFVEPGARATGIGATLLCRFERWAQEQGAVAITMIAPSVAVGALYERRGYVEIERCYLKRLP